ncbi:MAG: glycerol-3-phosphate dehydrogenase subunit GlpB [Halanaeroarchaeum sp.]
MTDHDVLVVGGGLAGRIAALSAADAGASVHLVSGAEDTSRQSAGLVNLLGYLADADAPVSDPLDRLADVPPAHPYRRLGVDAVRSAVEFAADELGDAIVGLDDPRNALLPTELGVPAPSFGHPPTMTAGRLSRGDPMLLVDVDPLPDFDAAMAAHRLDGAVPFDVAAATIDLGDRLPPDADRQFLAKRIDETPGTSHETAIVDDVADAIDRVDVDPARVGLPAVLGIERVSEVHERLSDRLGVPVFEIPTAPPSVSGVRFDARLDDALASRPVARTEGVDVVETAVHDGRVESVAIDRFGDEEWVSADRVVLATGGFVGGGLVGDRAGVREPLFDVPVEAPADRTEWTAERPFEGQPFARFGLATDESLRPLVDGDPVAETLFAAGDVLGGFDGVRERSGGGVAIATGYAAGRLAAGVSP